MCVNERQRERERERGGGQHAKGINVFIEKKDLEFLQKPKLKCP